MVAARAARLEPFAAPPPVVLLVFAPAPLAAAASLSRRGESGGVGGMSATSPCALTTSLLGHMCPNIMPLSCCFASSSAHLPMTWSESRLSTIAPLAFWPSSH